VSTELAGGFVAAIDIGGTKIAVATAGLDGAVLEQRRLPTETELGAPQAVRRALDAAADLIERTRARCGGPCLALGAVSPGIAREDRIDLVPTLPGWERLGLAGLLRDGLGLERVVVANDVKAAGAAEVRWGSLRGVDPALYVGIGTGLAAAVVVGAASSRALTGRRARSATASACRTTARPRPRAGRRWRSG